MMGLKKALFKYTGISSRIGMAKKYPYMLEPIQLATMINEMDRLKGQPGVMLEIGVFQGWTTRFMCEHLAKAGMTDERYIAIDTFASFPEEDVDFEATQRNKERHLIARKFQVNDFENFKKNFAAFPFVEAMQSDCVKVDYSQFGGIKLALLDVDLYLPTQKALPEIYENLVQGGVILVDDVMDDNIWDGAHQAYHEFCEEHKIKPEIIGNKCGILRKE